MIKLSEENVKEAAVTTLIEIWSRIDWSKVTGTRAMGIWDEFTSKVKGAAMTTNEYEKFVEKLCRKMDIRSLKYREINDFSNQSDEFKKAILQMFREKTLTIVLKLQLNNQIRKEELQMKKDKKKRIEELNKKLENSQVSFTDKGAIAHEN